MNEPQITVHLDSPRRTYQPGGWLSGECRLDDVALHEIQGLELSVLWYTEGKGDEDFAVHHFQRHAPDEVDETNAPSRGQRIEAQRPLQFKTQLPHTPLSYEGLILKIRWCVRVRLFLPHNKSIVHDEPFRLGHVPPVELPDDVPAEKQAE